MRSTSDYRSLFEDRLSAVEYKGGNLAGLYEPVAYGVESGGKRLRPVLVLMGCEAFGGDVEEALWAACGVEMFHNFTLLHDDVMDDSDVRRGRPTVHCKWDVNTAILSGDTMLTMATQLMMRVPDAALRGVLDTFNGMAIEVYEGQRLDMDFETRDDVTSDEYIEMITLKTGALLGGSVAIGGMIAGGKEKSVKQLMEYGRCLGVAFQIQDDYLDVFGDANTFGKPIGGDIVNGKKTYLLLESLGREGADAAALREAMSLTDNALKIQTVRRLYERMGIDETCRKAILHWTGRALRALKKADLPADAYECFSKFADKLIGRKK